MTAKWKNLPYFSTQKCKNIYRQKNSATKSILQAKTPPHALSVGCGGAVLTALQYPFLLPKIGELRIFKFIVFI
jgi:hypothetical protein